MKMNEFDVDENQRPLFPPKIINTEILWNPYDNIKPRNLKKRKLTNKEEPPKKKIKVAKK